METRIRKARSGEACAYVQVVQVPSTQGLLSSVFTQEPSDDQGNRWMVPIVFKSLKTHSEPHKHTFQCKLHKHILSALAGTSQAQTSQAHFSALLPGHHKHKRRKYISSACTPVETLACTHLVYLYVLVVQTERIAMCSRTAF